MPMQDAENPHSRFGNPVKDQVLTYWKTPVARAQIVTPAAGVRVVGEQGELACQKIHE